MGPEFPGTAEPGPRAYRRRGFHRDPHHPSRTLEFQLDQSLLEP